VRTNHRFSYKRGLFFVLLLYFWMFPDFLFSSAAQLFNTTSHGIRGPPLSLVVTSRPTGTAKIDLRQNRQNRPPRTRGCTTGRPQWRRSAPGRSQPAVPRDGAPRKRARMPALRQWMVPQPSTADSGPQQRRRRSLPRLPGGTTGRLHWRHGVSALPQGGVAKLGAPRNRA